MKPLPLKIDDFLIEKIEEEARRKKQTKAEVVRTALIYFLLDRQDLLDAELISSRLNEPDIPEHSVKFF